MATNKTGIPALDTSGIPPINTNATIKSNTSPDGPYKAITPTANLPETAVTQVYAIINDVAKQTMGKEAIKVVDTASLITLGTSMQNMPMLVETFTKNLAMRIGRTIFVFREYTNNLAGLMLSDMEWGGIVQKIDMEMPEFIEDEAFNLEDGKSVDMYIVRKPKIFQTFFYGLKPYSNFLTVWKKDLQVAFTSAGGAHAFIAMMRGKVLNMLNLAMENLARMCMANYIAITQPNQRIHLLTQYNNIYGTTLTAAGALYDERFLRYAIGQFNLYSMNIRSMATIYNGFARERFTPDEKQIFITLNDFEVNMATQVQYAAYNESKVNKKANITVPYWQSPTSKMAIHVLAKTDGSDDSEPEDIELNNIVGMIVDRDALGTFRNDPDVEATPMNARGLYTNTFWHEDQLWFNDLSENGLVFLLD